jgi:beta-lactamase class A
MSGNRLWERLERQLHGLVDEFPGVAGIGLSDLVGGLTLQINGDDLFPTASTIKIHVLTQLLARAEQGEIDLQERITALPPDPALGDGVLAYLEGPFSLTLLDVAILMITVSDNTATNLCIDRAGIEGTNELLRTLGLTSTRLRRKMMDHIAAVREQENISTPLELVQMLTLLHEGKPSPWVAQKTLEILRKPKLGYLDRALPPGIAIANKPGSVEAARCDVGLVYLPRRPYILAVMTKYSQCGTVAHEDFIARIGSAVHATLSILDQSNRYGRIVYNESKSSV